MFLSFVSPMELARLSMGSASRVDAAQFHTRLLEEQHAGPLSVDRVQI